jgi:hypothetical protein
MVATVKFHNGQPSMVATVKFHNGQPSHGGDRKIFEVMTSTLPKGTLGSVASLLAATLYQEILVHIKYKNRNSL